MPEVRRNLTRYRSHPKYNTVAFGHDVAVLRLKDPVEFKPHIQPICLPKIFETNFFGGEMGTIASWGDNFENGTSPSILKKVRAKENCTWLFLELNFSIFSERCLHEFKLE